MSFVALPEGLSRPTRDPNPSSKEPRAQRPPPGESFVAQFQGQARQGTNAPKDQPSVEESAPPPQGKEAGEDAELTPGFLSRDRFSGELERQPLEFDGPDGTVLADADSTMGLEGTLPSLANAEPRRRGVMGQWTDLAVLPTKGSDFAANVGPASVASFGVMARTVDPTGWSTEGLTSKLADTSGRTTAPKLEFDPILQTWETATLTAKLAPASFLSGVSNGQVERDGLPGGDVGGTSELRPNTDGESKIGAPDLVAAKQSDASRADKSSLQIPVVNRGTGSVSEPLAAGQIVSLISEAEQDSERQASIVLERLLQVAPHQHATGQTSPGAGSPPMATSSPILALAPVATDRQTEGRDRSDNDVRLSGADEPALKSSSTSASATQPLTGPTTPSATTAMTIPMVAIGEKLRLFEAQGLITITENGTVLSLSASNDLRPNMSLSVGIPPTSPQAIAAQIVQTSVANNGKKTELILEPAELGKLTLRMTTDERSITLFLSAERPETLDLLRRNIETLAQEFRALGYENVNFSFDSSDQSGADAEAESSQSGDTQMLAQELVPEETAPHVRGLGNGRLDIRL